MELVKLPNRNHIFSLNEVLNLIMAKYGLNKKEAARKIASRLHLHFGLFLENDIVCAKDDGCLKGFSLTGRIDRYEHPLTRVVKHWLSGNDVIAVYTPSDFDELKPKRKSLPKSSKEVLATFKSTN